jgi:hypothetical protein
MFSMYVKSHAEDVDAIFLNQGHSTISGGTSVRRRTRTRAQAILSTREDTATLRLEQSCLRLSITLIDSLHSDGEYRNRLVTKESLHHTSANVKTLPDSGNCQRLLEMTRSRDLLWSCLIYMIHFLLVQEHFRY